MQNRKRNPWRHTPPLVALFFLLSLGLMSGMMPAEAQARIRVTVDSDSGSTTANVPIEGGGKDVVRMGENIEIGPNETVEGDVVAIGGAITVAGHVLGDVVSVGGGIDLKSTATVNGDVVCVGGVLNREEGATVHGQNVSVGVLPKGFSKLIPHAAIGRGAHGAGRALSIWWDFLRYAGIFLIGLVLYLAFTKRMSVIRETTRSRFWLSLVIGFASIIGVSVGLILLCITCIGIIVAIPGLFVFILALIAGGAVAASIFGEVITRRRATDTGSWALTMAVGIGALLLVRIIGTLLCCTGGAGEAIGKSLHVITTTAWTILVMSGFGGLIVSRLGRPEPGPAPEGAPVTPPPASAAP